ncbi:hypothetical protein D3C85_1911470 [compost metagenome]
MPQIAARAGIHRRQQLETRGIGYLPRGSGDMDLAALQRFPQHLQYFAIVFRQLIQKQHAAMGKADLAGTRVGTTC